MYYFNKKNIFQVNILCTYVPGSSEPDLRVSRAPEVRSRPRVAGHLLQQEYIYIYI